MFVATGPVPTEEDQITSSAFWPPVLPSAARAAVRLEGNVTAARLRHALITAIAAINAELADWRTVRQAEGYAALAAIPAEQIDDVSVLAIDYQRAVYATAKAELIERYRDFDATNAADRRADALDPTADDYRRDARLAVRRILGLSPSTVELI